MSSQGHRAPQYFEAQNPAPGTAPPEASGAAALAAEQEQPWLRLDKRMLLVHPVDEVVKLLPVLLISLIVGSQSGNHIFGLAVVAALVAYALLRWFTTSYRIGPVHVQLRTGVFQKNLLSVPRNRIRSVDVESGVLHRVLGLSIVRIGTGQQSGHGDSKRFELNALDSALVPALRAALLAGHQEPAGSADAGTAQAGAAAWTPETEIAHWTPAWVRYAPFSVTGVLTVAAVVGLAFQYGLGSRIANSPMVTRGLDSAQQLGTAVAVALALLALLVVASALSCVRYLIAFGNLRVTDTGTVLHVSHGLLKTRQTTLDRTRLRGTSLREPLLLRAAGGARLDAIMTGISAEKAQSTLLMPQSPKAEAERVAGVVLGGAHSPTTLTAHGPAARRRRYTRALIPVTTLAATAGVAAALGAPLRWPLWAGLAAAAVAATALAWDRYRGLGHAAPPGWLITRSGSLDRSRASLEADGIIGWTVRQSYFQRRAGVATVVAATPAGAGHYEVLDLPADRAWALIETVTPGAGDIWIRTT
ncbi:PH domain-containing protein [Rhodococcus sp. NPDC058514]|uniref:PH domain-containing protein n=1 Tax=unclassified Rhodococcus (in: high G+C Gram-positive bacteria) TaxID=192944 RepID=UPI003668D2A0